MITINCIGAGRWGPNLIRSFTNLPDARVRMVGDLDEQRLELVGRRIPGIETTTNIEAVIHDIASGSNDRATLNNDSDLWMDDHNAPALLVLPNGDYLAMYAGHNHSNNYKSYYRTYSGGGWGQEGI